MIVLEDFPNFTLQHDPAGACLYATWHGQHDDVLTRAQCGLIRYHVRATGSTKLLNDGLLDQDSWPQAARWLARQYFEYLVQDGVQVIAWVLPRNTAALHDTTQVLAHLRQPKVDTFLDVQAAADWLRDWPAAGLKSSSSITAAAFMLWPPAQQLPFTQQYGLPLPASWETDYYIKSYQVLATLRVDVVYQLHSGAFYQLRVQHLPA